MTIRITFFLIVIISLVPGCASTYREQKRLFAAPPKTETALARQDRQITAHEPPPLPMAKISLSDKVTPFIDPAGLDRKNELNRLIALILTNNPAIRSATEKVRARMETYGQEQAINDLLATYQAFNSGKNPGVGPIKMAGHNIPLPGPASLRSRLVTLEVERAELTREKIIAGNITRGRKLYYRLVHNRSARRITNESLILFRDFEKVALARYKGGKTTYQEIIAVKIKKERLATRVADLDQEEKSLRRDLVELCAGTMDGFTFTAPQKSVPLPDPDQVIATAEKFGLNLRLATNRRQLLATMLDLGRAMAAPDFSAGLSRRMGSDINGIFAGKKILKPGRVTDGFKGANLFYLERLRIETTAAQSNQENAARKTRADARRAWEAVDRNMRQVKLLRESVIPLTRAALDVARRGFEAGTTTFAGLTRAEENWLNNRLALAKGEMLSGAALAELALATGRNLEDIL